MMKPNVVSVFTPIALLALAATHQGAAQNVDFELPSYVAGDINTQEGWKKTGPYDHAVDSSFGVPGFGDQSLRISNAVTSGSFGDHTFAPPLANAVGETDSTDGPFSRGTLQSHYEMEFDIASTVPTAQQPGLFVNVSPDRGDGSRMSYLGFSDEPGGIEIIFYDTPGMGNPANFDLTSLGVYDRSQPHHIRLTLDAVDGPDNDVVKVWIDGVLTHVGGSWENYYRFDAEASAEQSPRIVKTVLFATRGPAAPATGGMGFLFDNFTQSSGVTYSCAGFDAPMDQPISVKKKNRVLPLKMVCTNSAGDILGDSDIAAPIVQVTRLGGGTVTTPVDDVFLAAGQGTDGNEFEFNSGSMNWSFNLQTKNFSGSGTYIITAIGGGTETIASSPMATFVIQ